MQDIYRLGKELYSVYTGPANLRFFPIMAGITLPDPDYEIRRSSGECYVFEYVLSGRGTVQQDEKTVLVKGGDVYLLHPGHFHHYFPDPKDPWEKIHISDAAKLAHRASLMSTAPWCVIFFRTTACRKCLPSRDLENPTTFSRSCAPSGPIPWVARLRWNFCSTVSCSLSPPFWAKTGRAAACLCP